ncbi:MULTISPECIES: 2-succinyl-5-enolpyruvyl-6-hydroxy-3-cyclohexene-1-carboxylic-acid synthase [Pseudanabaena]|uniref:2-succinyl-5-enolpyruvyl-6-hydroxy-3-cyclohexene-1-carboxylate synthase n=2 Tax=Pseudanabaena TaxID=1152 RepID=L8MW50_9CYAN|nr:MULTISPECIES: 2-succinyl-5-enolpyruvyl-6-hydroxy-3-cyclohexene-1-carboxylic-acid synthase [Pseudanabaena]ELS32187.1 2-succinyl-5-enolpyruvyl-6-hydroxy-3- cyclohexene-1-carboxylate synthase [Pseudanabaena biceps PCC 7429]MDG3495588.1 2-succinyl-5-enolpyruvyl-6-hydroxy-3-cyclohexene-1-carboxylic-acid synthase [Pseudanabaena catenata USMAC16]
MNSANRNTVWASIVAEELYRSGVRTVCISPGSRSTPLVIAFAEMRDRFPDLQLLVHIDERSSSFFALGLAKVQRAPVALLCTSGTAAANYYPAIIEAYYSRIPLVVLTADRPPEMRDCGSGQTIDQINIYGKYVRYFFEVGTPEILGLRLRYLRSLVSRSVSMALGKGDDPAGAVHLNFPFPDPMPPIPVPEDIPDDLELSSPEAVFGNPSGGAYSQVITGMRSLGMDAIATIANQIISHPKGVLVVGVYDSPPEFLESVRHLARATGYPLLIEATGASRHNEIGHYDSFLRSANFCNTHVPQMVIRFGAMPTSKSYLVWLQKHINCQQIVVGSTNSDPTHGITQSLNVHPVNFCEQLAYYLENYAQPMWQDKQWRLDFELAESITEDVINKSLVTIDELFDGKVYAELAELLPAHTYIYVASSTPIRDLDTFFHSDRPITVLANRGANGIDGTLSSALGAAWGCDRPMVLICGDLAFYHDLNGLLAAKKYPISLTVILLNNDGGGIFDLLPISQFENTFEEFFGTSHALDFAPIVSAYDCEHILIRDWRDFRNSVTNSLNSQGTQVLEIKSDRKRNKELHFAIWDRVIESCDRQFMPPH